MSAVRAPCSRAVSTALSTARAASRSLEAQVEHHRGAQDGRARVGEPLAGDVRRRAVDGLVEAHAAGADARARQHADAAGEHRRLVAEHVAEEVLGGDDVELLGVADELHGAVVHEHVAHLDVRVALRDPDGHGAPQARALEHVGLVDRVHQLAAAAGDLEGVLHEPVDLGLGVDHRVVRRVRGALALAEVHAAGELAHDQHVDAVDHLGLERAVAGQRLEALDRAQVGEELEALAHAEQSLLRARLVRVGGVPLGAADGAEQHRVGGLAALDEAVFHGRAELVDGAAAHDADLVGEQVAELLAGGVEHALGGVDDLRPDAIAGQGHDAVAAQVRGGRQGRSLRRAGTSRTAAGRRESMSSCMNGGNASDS